MRTTAAAAALAVLWTGTAAADSPLTSADFHEAYADAPIVAHAASAGLDEQVLAALRDPEVPNDVRAAVINALGWNVDGQEHSARFADYVAEAHGRSRRELTISDLATEEVFALGYLLAMDDYFTLRALGGRGQVERADALRLLDEAVRRAPGDFAVAMVRALVKAQKAMDDDWCKVYTLVADVVEGFQGERNLRRDAVDAIMEYIVLYRDECPGSGADE